VEDSHFMANGAIAFVDSVAGGRDVGGFCGGGWSREGEVGYVLYVAAMAGAMVGFASDVFAGHGGCSGVVMGGLASLDDYGKPERGGKPHRCGMY